MIEAFKHFFNSIASPVTIFTMATLIFILFVSFPAFMTSPPVSLAILAMVLLFFGIGLTDEHFRTIVSMPDNVPIVGMIFVFGYFTWFAMRKAVLNDARIAKGEPTAEQLETNDKVLVFPYLIFIEFVVALVYGVGWCYGQFF